MRRRTVAAIVLIVLGSGSCGRRPVTVSIPTVPPTLALRDVTKTTLGVDHTKDRLPTFDPQPGARRVPIDFAGGTVTLTGLVVGPDGPVPGAIVRLERLVDDEVAVREVITDGAGRYSVPNIKAGRLRLRAWRAPDLAAIQETVAFVAGKTSNDIRVDKFGKLTMQWALSPSPPILGLTSNVAVQISAALVGPDGVVRQQPVPGVGVTVTPLGYLQPDVIQESLTNALGKVQTALRCNGLGDATLTVSLATGESWKVTPPECSPVPTTTTPETTTTTVPEQTTTTIAPLAATLPVTTVVAVASAPVPPTPTSVVVAPVVVAAAATTTTG